MHPGACVCVCGNGFWATKYVFLTLKKISAIPYAAILLKEASYFRAH